MGAKIDAKSTQTRFLTKSQTSIYKGTIEGFDRLLVVLTTGEYHNELTKDEERLCKLLIGNCKSFDILVATDSSLGRQVCIDYATFNSEYPLVR